MANWYSKGQSQYTSGNFHMAYYIDMNGYDEANYDSQDIEGEGASGDPFMAFGIDTQTWVYGQGQVEIGLLGSYRIRINSSGIYGWDGDSWEDLISGGRVDADAIHDNVGDEIHQITLKGTPVAADELVIEDSVASWAKKRIAISSLPSSGEPNTMSNEGTGTGLFWQKDGVNLELNNLKSENDRLTVSLDGTSHDIEFTLNEANIVHANISGGTATSAHHVKTVSSEILLASMGEKNHVSLTNKNAETDVKHITDAQLGALHTIYSLEVHNNDYHDPDYKVDFSENTAFNKNFGTLGTEVCVGNDARLSDARTPSAHVLATTGPHSDALPLTDLDSWVAGSIIIGGVVDWEHLVKGADTYVLKMGATYPAWGQVAWGEVTGKPTEFTPISHNNTYHSETYVTAAGAVSAIETDDTIYTKTEVNTNTYTRAQVDTAVATKDTKEEAHAYVEATALTMTQDITFKATQLFDGVDVSALATDLALQCTTAEAIQAVEDTGLTMGAHIIVMGADTHFGDFDLGKVGTVYHNETITQWLVQLSSTGYNSGSLYNCGLYYNTSTDILTLTGKTGLHLGMQSDLDIIDILSTGVRIGGANARVTTILDEDNMVSDSNSALATQQSIKKYIDDNVYSEAEVDARIVVQNTHPAGTIDIAIDALILTHKGLPNDHHVAFVQGDADALYSVLAHLHDDRYYTETEINANTYTRAQVDAHNWNEADILDLDKYTVAEVDAIEERFDEQGEAFPGPGSEGDLFYSRADDSWYRWNAEALAWVEVGVMGAIASSTDNLGNHTATQDLNMSTQKILNVVNPTTDQGVATKKYVDDNSINNVIEDTTPQLSGNLDFNNRWMTNLAGASIGITEDLIPNAHKTLDLGLAIGAFDECYADNWNNVGPRFIDNPDLYQRYKDMVIEAHPDAKTSVGDSEINISKLIPEIYQPDRYEKQYQKDLKKKPKKRKGLKPLNKITPQELGISLNQWIVVNCMIIKELMSRNEILENRIKKLEDK